MNDADRLVSILQLAESKENSAAAIYSKEKQDLEFNRSKLEELRSFRDEYRSPKQAFTADRLQSTRQFLSQLSSAIDQQEQQVEDLLMRLEQKEADWSQRRVERKSLEKVIEKRRTKRAKDRARLDQNMLDEMSAWSTPD